MKQNLSAISSYEQSWAAFYMVKRPVQIKKNKNGDVAQWYIVLCV
jgi:hypothetical protein